jgi:hypothetical protein
VKRKEVVAVSTWEMHMKSFSFTDLWTPSPKQREFLNIVLDPKSKYILYGGA